MTTMTIDELSVFGPGAGDLVTPPSPYDDFWGTITGFSLTDSEQGRFKDGKLTDEKWLLRVMRMEITMDESNKIHNEDFTLPYNKETGEVLRNADGSAKRPDKNSKWGRFETILVQNGLDFTHPNDLIGLHARFVRRSVPTEGSRPIDIRGRYVVEYDGYNNSVRKDVGLPVREVEKNVLVFPETSAPSEAAKAEQELKALALIPTRTRVEILNELTKAGLSLNFGRPDYLAKLVEEGVVVLEGRVYQRGANYPLS